MLSLSLTLLQPGLVTDAKQAGFERLLDIGTAVPEDAADKAISQGLP